MSRKVDPPGSRGTPAGTTQVTALQPGHKHAPVREELCRLPTVGCVADGQAGLPTENIM